MAGGELTVIEATVVYGEGEPKRAVAIEPAVPPKAAVPPAAPPKAAAGPAPAATRDDLLRLWRQTDGTAGHCALVRGRSVWSWLRLQADRAAALRDLSTALAAIGFRGRDLHVSRFVGIFWLAKLLSGSAQIGTNPKVGEAWPPEERLGATILRNLLPLARRDGRTQQWELRAQSADAARTLWLRILVERLTAAQVAEEVQRIRPPRVGPATLRRQQLWQTIARTANRLSYDHLGLLQQAIEQAMARKRPAAA